jgi:hypothetical protein
MRCGRDVARRGLFVPKEPWAWLKREQIARETMASIRRLYEL